MLNVVQQQNFEFLYRMFDKNGNGTIEEADFMKAFEGVKEAAGDEKASIVDKSARRWYLALKVFADENKDKVISREEWMGWATDMAKDVAENNAINRKHAHFADAVFASITMDDRKITATEYATWFSSFGLCGDAATIFATLDANNDGELTKSEFDDLVVEFVKGDQELAGYQLFGEPNTLIQFVENKINTYAQRILEYTAEHDTVALGELQFYMSLRKTLLGKENFQDRGMMDAVNDVLKYKGIIKGKKKFYQ